MAKKRTKKIIVTRKDLWRLRGELTARRQENVTWAIFSELTGIPRNTIIRIIVGDRNAGPITLRRLMTLRDHGIVLHLSDFYADRHPTKD